MSIESKKYVANVEDIRKLTRENVDAVLSLASTRRLYFLALIGTTRAELPAGKNSKEQADILRTVHDRFYTGVVEIIKAKGATDAPRIRSGEKRRRWEGVNAKSNFARSAFGTIRRWLAAGHDLTTLNLAALTEMQLRKETPIAAHSRKPAPKQTQKRVSSLVEKILAQTRQLASANPADARAVLDSVVTRVMKELSKAEGVSVSASSAPTRRSGRGIFSRAAAANASHHRERRAA